MQALVNGAIDGLSIALLSLAFSVVYVPTRHFYIGLAGIYVFIPFVAWACLNQGISLSAALFVGLAAGIGLSVLTELIGHKPLVARKASSGAHMVSSLGVYIVLTQVAALVWGPQTRVLRKGLDSVLMLGKVLITRTQLITLVTALILLLLFFLWLRLSLPSRFLDYSKSCNAEIVVSLFPSTLIHDSIIP